MNWENMSTEIKSSSLVCCRECLADKLFIMHVKTVPLTLARFFFDFVSELSTVVPGVQVREDLSSYSEFKARIQRD